MDTDQSTFSTAEKLFILRSVNMFIETPEDGLHKLAALLEQRNVPQGETIFHKGDHGDCLYIIARGRVRVHDGNLDLNDLGPRDVFGEMAVLDAEPRMASVTAVEDTQLFRLGQDQFYELMGTQVEIMREVIRGLCQFLRARVRDLAEDYEYMQQMALVSTAALALEAGQYQPELLDSVVTRTDELGQLGRVFRRMAQEVYAREQQLREEIQVLRIEVNETRKALDVKEITETTYFQELQERAKQFRNRSKQKKD